MVSPGYSAPHIRLQLLDRVDSTNSEARRLIEAGEPAPFAVAARRQTAGRGRYRRNWQSFDGNLHLSIVEHVGKDMARLPQLSYVTGLAVYECLRKAGAPAAALALKWPNDVLLEGGKVAGILLETVQRHGGCFVIVGIGVNLVAHPSDALYPATDLATATGDSADMETIAAMMLAHWGDEFAAWRGQGFAPLRARWLEVAAFLDKPITVRQETVQQRGVFRGLDETGALILETAAGMTKITAGDVMFQNHEAR